MPAGQSTKNATLNSSASFRGLNEIVGDKLVGVDELTEASNVVIRDGKIAPRPGIDEVQSESFTFAPLTLYQDAGTITAICAGSNKVFFTINADNDIWMMDRDGQNLTKVVSTGTVTAPNGIAYDEANDDLYVVEGTTNVIKITDATTSASAGTHISGSSGDFFGITLDLTNNYIYLTKRGATSEIKRATLAGSGLATIVTASGGVLGWSEIVVDTSGGKIYWNDEANFKIYRANLDGSSDEEYLDASGPPSSTILGIAKSGSNIYLGISTIPGSLESITTSSTTRTSHITGYKMRNLFVEGTTLFAIHDDLSGSGTTISRIELSSIDFVSVYPMQRVLLQDLELFQLRDSSNSENYYALRKVTDAVVQRIPLGYTPGSPNFWCTNSRTADDTGAFGSKSDRASFAWQGTGLNEGRGGVLIADGSGTYVFNYVPGNHKVRYTFTTTGNGTITVNGETTSTFSDTSTAANVAIALRLLSTVDHATVTKTGTGAGTYFDIEFGGINFGKAVVVSATNGTATVSLTTTQTGGTETGANAILRPTGLPRPATPALGSTAAGNPDGLYSWVVTFVSSHLRLESPPSAASALSQLSSSKINIDVTIPTTLWFRDVVSHPAEGIPFKMVDRVRLYRRKWGSAASATPDGIGANGQWVFVKEVFAGNGTSLSIEDDTSDAALTDDPAPAENEYPPADANYVITHQGFAVYASASSRRIWISEPPKRGQLNEGQLGYEYVRNESFEDVQIFEASDFGFTGMVSDGNIVLMGTGDLCAVAQLSPFTDPTPNRFDILEGIPGPASHWVIQTGRGLREPTREIFWLSIDGYCYSYLGNFQATIISRNLRTTAESLVRKYWNDADTFGDLDSWMWADSGIDRQNNRLLFSGILSADNTRVVMVLSLDQRSRGQWTLWTLQPVLMWDTRNATTNENELSLALNGAKVYRLLDGSDDAGSSFNWAYAFGSVAAATPFQPIKLNEISLDFVTRDFGGADAQITAAIYADGATSATKTLATNKTIDDAEGLSFTQANVRGRRMKLRISGTQTADKAHPELAAVQYKFVPVGKDTR